MLYYIIRRCFAAVAMLFLISIITFGMFYAGPTDPARLTCGKNCTAQSIAANRHFLGLDKPVTTQYAEFVGGLFHERNYPDDLTFIKNNPDKVTHCPAPCLGYSPLQTALVTDFVKQRFPVTLSITLGAFAIWMVFGVGLGIVAALRRGHWLDRSLVGSLVDPLLVPHLLHCAAGVQLSIDPVADLPAAQLHVDHGRPSRLVQGAPASLADLGRCLRRRVHPADPGLHARDDGRGLPAHRTRQGPAGAHRRVQAHPEGMGRAAVDAVSVFDLPVIVALVLVAALFIVVANLVVDLLYGVIDPRVRLV